MKRLLLVKIDEAVGQKYELKWGTYFKKNLEEDLKLEKGKYWLISLGLSPINQLIVLTEQPETITIKAATEDH